jgi:hypothetical protein
MRNQLKKFFLYALAALFALSAVAGLSVFSSVSADITDLTGGQPVTTVIEPTVESKLVARHTTEYIEKPVTTIKYIERVSSEPVELRNFYDLDELKHWLTNAESETTVHLQSPDSTIDCDDYALAFQQKALEDGYIMSFEIIAEDEYNALFRNPLPSGQSLHAINLVIIGNSAYYVEPQTGEIVLAAHLD